MEKTTERNSNFKNLLLLIRLNGHTTPFVQTLKNCFQELKNYTQIQKNDFRICLKGLSMLYDFLNHKKCSNKKKDKSGDSKTEIYSRSLIQLTN